MKRLLLLLFLSGFALGQTTAPTMPQAWVNSREYMNFAPTVTCTLGGGSCGGVNSPYALSQAGLNQAICDWAADGIDDEWLIKFPHGQKFQTGSNSTCVQGGSITVKYINLVTKIVSGAAPTKFFVVDSDTPLPDGQTVCSHGITDAAGTRQPPTGDISTWWSGTNYGCTNDIGSMWTVEGTGTPGNLGMLIQSGIWDNATNIGPSHYVFKNAEFRPQPGIVVSGTLVNLAMDPLAPPSQTMYSQGASHVHFRNIYMHGDAKEWCNALNGITWYRINSGGSGYVNNDTGTVNTGGGNATYKVTGVSAGAVTSFIITNSGSGYSVGSSIATTATSGAGGGFKINILGVDPYTNPGCISSTHTGGAGTNSISTGFKISGCLTCSLTYSYMDYMTRIGAEGHLVSVDEGFGPTLISHNWLSGEWLSFFAGGIDSTDPLYNVFDTFIWQNRMTAPPSWVGTFYQGPGSLAQKNKLEYKNGKRALVEANIMEWSDSSGGQAGQCLELNVRAGGLGNIHTNNYQVTNEDITVTNNVCRHAATGFTFAGRSGYPANGFGSAQAMRRIAVNNNLIYDVGNESFFDTGGTIAQAYAIHNTGSGNAFICNGTNSSGTITLTCVQGPDGLNQTTIQQGDLILVSSCSDSTWNIPTTGSNFLTVKGTPALAGTDGVLQIVYSQPGAVSASATGCVVDNGQGFPSNLAMQHNTIVMDNITGDVGNARNWAGTTANFFTDSGCSGSGPTHSSSIVSMSRTSGVVTATLTSSTGWQGSYPSNIIGPGVQTIVEVLASGTFTGTFYYLGLGSAQGANGVVTWSQAGQPDEVASILGTAENMGVCQYNNFMQQQLWKNNLVAINTTSTPSCPSTPAVGWNGWISQGGGNQEGCPSGASASSCSENMIDTTNSVVTYTDFPGRCSAKYMEVGGVNAGAIPPVTLTFPQQTVNTAAANDGTGIGMASMINGAAFNSSSNNPFVDYKLVPGVSGSPYAAGNTNQADDGTDLGVNFPNLTKALTVLRYQGCSTNPVDPNYCGPTGPFQDAPPSGGQLFPGTKLSPGASIH